MFMASMIECQKPVLRVLDPGAGVGSLSAALVAAMCRRPRKPNAIFLTAYEVDPALLAQLRATLDLCTAASAEAGIQFQGRVVSGDFLEAGASTFAGDLFAPSEEERFDCAILNPPYRKIRTESRERRLLQAAGMGTTNLYTGFLAVTARLLNAGGEMVAITPRSFCNGVYFEPFRRFFLRRMRFTRVHVFESRDQAFAEDEVLQENVIFRATATVAGHDERVVVSSSRGPEQSGLRIRTVKHSELVHEHDPHAFIHIVPDGNGDSIRRRVAALEASLADLGLTVSTGRVVDFRARDLLRPEPGRHTIPLIYPCHLAGGFVEWPSSRSQKPNALDWTSHREDLVVPAGHYVVVRRLSAKEEPRRVVAAVYDPGRVPGEWVAFENHLNYYHLRGSGLPPALAKGLAAFLNSTLIDCFFRQFSGHTQVNAADLRSLKYPSWQRLVALGRRIGRTIPAQPDLDALVDDVVFGG
jgi:adenine-specific DNA-methyltransferase